MIKKIIIYIILLFQLALISAQVTDTTFNNQFRRDIGGWIAADATYSIYLPDGRTLWLFGDTFIGETDGISIVDGSKFVRNTAVVQDGTNLQTLFSGTRSNPDDFIKTTTPDSTWYWPDHGIVDNDTLRIFLAKFKHKDNGASGFNFEHDGNDIANFTFPGLEFISTVPIHSHPVNNVLYGDRLLADSSFIYIYGRKNDNPEFNIPYPHVARTTPGMLMNQQWEYYNGSGWSTDPSDTKRINNFQVSQQYSVSKHRGKYILLTQDIWLSPDIWTFTADSPVGPWRSKTRIYSTPETGGGNFTYNAYAHPQFNINNELLVSYNLNGDFWSIFSNVEIYRPQFIRVPYMNISYDFWPNDIENIILNKKTQFKLYPNPVNDFAVLEFESAKAGELTLQVLDLRGSIRYEESSLHYNLGFNSIYLPLEYLSEGSYILRIRFNQNSEYIQLLKMDN